MDFDIPDIVGLFRTKGHSQYDGEPVTQLEHALQSAHQAEQAGADSALIAAALLHDLGQLLHELGSTPTQQGLDDLSVPLPALSAAPVRTGDAGADPSACGRETLSVRA